MVKQAKARIKEWGISLGVTKGDSLEDFFGRLKFREKIDLQKMKDESRRRWSRAFRKFVD